MTHGHIYGRLKTPDLKLTDFQLKSNLIISPNKLSLAIRWVKSKYTTRLGVSLVNTIQAHSEFIWKIKQSPSPVYDSNRNYVATVRVQDSQYIQCRIGLCVATGWIVCTLSSQIADRQRQWEFSGQLRQRSRAIKIWDLTSGACKLTLLGHTGEVMGHQTDFIEQILASGSFDGTIKLWNLSTGKLIRTLTGDTRGHRLDKQYEQTLVSGSYDQRIKLSGRTGQCVNTIQTGCLHNIVGCCESR